MLLCFSNVSFAVRGSPFGLSEKALPTEIRLCCFGTTHQFLLDRSAYLLHAPPTAPAGAEGDQGVLCINFLVLVFNVTFSSKCSNAPSVRTANKHSCHIFNVMQPTEECRSHLWVWLLWTEGCWAAVGDDQGHCQGLMSWLTAYNTKNYNYYNTKTGMTVLAALMPCLLEPLY